MEKMILFWITLLTAIIGSNAEGEFCVIHTPDSLTFIRTGETWESHLKEIFSAALGLSVEYNAEWQGMYVMDPFATPEAVVVVHVDGVPSLSEYTGIKTKIFSLIVDENEPHTFKGLQARIRQEFTDGRNKIVNVKLSNDKRHLTIRRAFGNLNVTANRSNQPRNFIQLNEEVEEDLQFINELETLQIVIGKIQAGGLVPDNLIDFFHFRFRTLHVLSDFYGPVSAQTKEAKQLLGEAIQELDKAFINAYDGSVLTTVVTTDVAHTRRSARSVTNTPARSENWPYQWTEPPLDWQKIPPKPTTTSRRPNDEEFDKIYEEEIKRREEEGRKNIYDIKNKAGNWKPSTRSDEQKEKNSLLRTFEDEEDEPSYKHHKPKQPYAMFNICLWLGVSIGFCILAVVYACMDMDPGRDTIIYRLTAMRTKKEM